MRERDWQMLTSTPPEWSWIGDITDWMLRPFLPIDYWMQEEYAKKEVAFLQTHKEKE